MVKLIHTLNITPGKRVLVYIFGDFSLRYGWEGIRLIR